MKQLIRNRRIPKINSLFKKKIIQTPKNYLKNSITNYKIIPFTHFKKPPEKQLVNTLEEENPFSVITLLKSAEFDCVPPKMKPNKARRKLLKVV